MPRESSPHPLERNRRLPLVDARERRLAKNEILFREINEQIKHSADRHGIDAHQYEFLCECSNVDCTLRLGMTVAAYERLRSNPTHFATAPGHELPEIESVVEECDGYSIVQKYGEAAEIGRREDPRRD
jgi:hypothetical protein